MASGRTGEWKLVKSIDIPTFDGSILIDFILRGLISDDEICVMDKENKDTYVMNINTNHRHKVIKGQCHSGSYTTSCTSVDKNVIVCGKRRDVYTGKNLDGYITLYDRKWKKIRDISIPNNYHVDDTSVYVDVDRNGMILAAQCDQPNIYVINPADGKIVKTIKMQKGKCAHGEIQSLSSGDIVVKMNWLYSEEDFIVISRSGKKKAVIQSDHRNQSRCSVDKLTDTIYITYFDDKSICTVDQVSCDGIIEAKRIVEYTESYPSSETSSISQSFVYPFGKLVGLYNGKFYVYKKK